MINFLPLQILSIPDTFIVLLLFFFRLGHAQVHGGGNALWVGHSRLTAYAAARSGDKALAQRAWAEFFRDRRYGAEQLRTRQVLPPAVLRPVDEAPWVSTNDAAQWSLAAIQNLALIGDHLP